MYLLDDAQAAAAVAMAGCFFQAKDQESDRAAEYAARRDCRGMDRKACSLAVSNAEP